MGSKTLYRSETDKKICGLCGGLAEYLNMDATLIRLIVAAVIVFSGGSALVLYIIACLVVPKEPGIGNSHNIQQGSVYRSETPGTGTVSSSGSYYRSSSVESHTDSSSNIDEMMKEVEKKAMQKEIEELRTRLAQYEKNQNHDKGES